MGPYLGETAEPKSCTDTPTSEPEPCITHTWHYEQHMLHAVGLHGHCKALVGCSIAKGLSCLAITCMLW